MRCCRVCGFRRKKFEAMRTCSLNCIWAVHKETVRPRVTEYTGRVWFNASGWWDEVKALRKIEESVLVCWVWLLNQYCHTLTSMNVSVEKSIILHHSNHSSTQRDTSKGHELFVSQRRTHHSCHPLTSKSEKNYIRWAQTLGLCLLANHGWRIIVASERFSNVLELKFFPRGCRRMAWGLGLRFHIHVTPMLVQHQVSITISEKC